MSDREFLLLIRQALLMFVDAIERKLGMERTAEIRKGAYAVKKESNKAV